MNPFSSLLPVDATSYPRGLYNPFPTFSVNDLPILRGYVNLFASIPTHTRVLLIDGFHGVPWEKFRIQYSFAQGLKFSVDNDDNVEVEWIDFQKVCLSTPEEIRQRIAPFLGGEDRVFGTHYPFGPEVFFDAGKVAKLRAEIACRRGGVSNKQTGRRLTIVYGTGVGLLELRDLLWYIDIPKDLLQEYARPSPKQWLRNLGEVDFDEDSVSKTKPFPSFGDFYKRAYFVEWPSLGRLKQILLPKIDLLIDGQTIFPISEFLNKSNGKISSEVSAEITAISGTEFRKALRKLSKSPFRVRPWFYPGVWGGQFMKGHMGLDPVPPNYAWSFELIVTENGIVLESVEEKEKRRNVLEFSFDFLMFQEYVAVQGEDAAAQFGTEWPIRLDYLDTINGGNLSTQCHPRPNYMRRQFGETYTQDETYYITNATPDACVYLGLEETIDSSQFEQTFQKSFEAKQPLDPKFESFVHAIPSQPHDLFLIPNGTVHASGAGNLVLEISSTPYIFTFKLYDYVRKDLEGNLRPMNIERGAVTYRCSRDAKFVEENYFVRNPLMIEHHTILGKDSDETSVEWKVYQLYDRPETFYVIHRVEFCSEYHANTKGIGLAVSLVEGECVEILTKEERTAGVEKEKTEMTTRSTKLSYLESMLIPAAVGEYIVRNISPDVLKPCKLIQAFVRPGTGKTAALNDPNDG